MNLSEYPGAIEVVIINEGGLTLNGPDHRTLGHIEVGEHAFTHESYLSYLLDNGLACLPSDFGTAKMALAKESLRQLDAELEAVEGDDVGDPSDETPSFASTSVAATKPRGGRPAKQKSV